MSVAVTGTPVEKCISENLLCKMSKPAIADYWDGGKTEANRWGRMGTSGDNSETLETKKPTLVGFFAFATARHLVDDFAKNP